MPISAPAGLIYTATSSTAVQLSWYAVSGAVSYNVYKSSDPMTLFIAPLNSSPITGLTYTDSSFNNTVANFYAVIAVDGSGNLSLPSNVTSIAASGLQALPQINLTQSKFDTLIDQKGYRCTWELASMCPCNAAGKTTTDATDLDCPLCHNKHYIYTPYPNVVNCLMTSLTRQSNPEVDGIWQAGTYNITTRHGIKLSFYDRLTFLDSYAPFSEVLIKGALNGIDAPRFPIVSFNPLVPIIDLNNIKYYQNTNFTLTPTGSIQWITGQTQPSVGTPYSVLYNTNWRILVVQQSHDIRSTKSNQYSGNIETFVDLPNQSLGKLEFFFETGQ